ncbi:MAG: hypothetical protein F6J93_02945 [Oscillatoria sp. SIO1A7]|nr:hypothetical protein [Oscillatoria sp. SIO1A7]
MPQQENLQPPTDEMLAIALACIRYCQSQDVDIISAMPDHFSEQHPDLEVNYDSVAEAINYSPTDRFETLKLIAQGSAPPQGVEPPVFDNNAAFPYEQEFGGAYWATGLTKREYFAAQALHGLIARSNTYPKLVARQLAYEAVKFADELTSALAATAGSRSLPGDTPEEGSDTPVID